MLAYKLLVLLWPTIYEAVSKALRLDTCPGCAIKEAMDTQEALAIIAEFRKFHGKN